MGSVTPRASGFWADSMSTDYFDAEDDVERLVDDDGRTPLDRTIDKIGMGHYQWALVSLCGFGWMADNMWLQAVAICLPRIQYHYSVPDQYIGIVSSSLFAGMMIGAIGWGTCSDLLGRSTAFNATLFFTSVFGLLSSVSYSYPSLCVILFFLGTSVGGSMPTDGTLLLEHMPQGKQYLVTALSVFFSLGAVLSAVIALLVIPQHSCVGDTEKCEDNQGWKYLLIALGLITLCMFMARMVFFRLHESPRYLVHAGRHQEAVEALQLISNFNGAPLQLELDDVEDERKSSQSSSPNGRGSPERTDYSATGMSPPQLDSHAYATPTNEEPDPILSIAEVPKDDEDDDLLPARPRPRSTRPSLIGRRKSSVYEKKLYTVMPSWMRRPLWAWWDRVLMVLTPEWRYTTLLMWAAWCGMSLAYTMFNVFLPKLLEGSTETPGVSKTIEESLWDVVIFTLAGCPGAILGAYLVQSALGRRWSLAGSTFITAFFCVVFAMVDSSWAVRASTVGIGLSATTMWAVLYGWTPEIFGTEVRGTACGIASALSRIGGMIAPVLGGVLLMMDRVVPVYTSVVVFLVSGVCVLMLRVKENSVTGAERTFVH